MARIAPRSRFSVPGFAGLLGLAALTAGAPAAALDDCTPERAIVEALGQRWCASDLGPPEARGERAAALVWEAIREDYVRHQGHDASGGEIESFLETRRQLADHERADRARRLDGLDARLAGDELDAETREQLEAQRTLLRRINAMTQAVADDRRALDEVGQARFDAHQRASAEESVMQWKLDRSLYERFGGTVVYQHRNPQEPVGAYRQLVESYAEGGKIQIRDPAVRKAFWSRFKIGDTLSAWVRPPEEVDFSQPWWERAAKRLGVGTSGTPAAAER